MFLIVNHIIIILILTVTQFGYNSVIKRLLVTWDDCGSCSSLHLQCP